MDKGLTQKELAEKLNILPEAYRKLEREESNPTKKTLINLSKNLNVSVSYLIGETSIKDSSQLLNISEQLNETQREDLLKSAKSKLKEQKN